ncbi:hypothetical protein ACFWVM_01345 [Nocardia fluminea]|uniref:AMP-binding enzyme n=1 Tax=Nocardia fluminea TaxID=134984 RepID=UPI00365C79AF
MTGLLHDQVTLSPDRAAAPYADEAGVSTVAADAWHRTGDHGEIGADEEIAVTGRISNVKKILGKLVSFDVTERELKSAIPGPQAACVDVELVPGVRILAAVVERETTGGRDGSTLHALARKHLPSHQAPRRFIFVETIPKRSNGKVDRAGVAELASAVTRDARDQRTEKPEEL